MTQRVFQNAVNFVWISHIPLKFSFQIHSCDPISSQFCSLDLEVLTYEYMNQIMTKWIALSIKKALHLKFCSSPSKTLSILQP